MGQSRRLFHLLSALFNQIGKTILQQLVVKNVHQYTALGFELTTSRS